MFELDGDLHVRRAIQQAEREKEELARIAEFSNPRPKPPNQATISPPVGLRDRLEQGSALLAQGIGWGGAAGMILGAFWAIRYRHTNPTRVCLTSALNLSLLGAQFVAFRELAPVGLQRLTDRLGAVVGGNTTDSTDPFDMQPFSNGNWFQRLSASVPGGLDLPSQLNDLDAEDEQVLGSALAGGAAGYVSTSIQARQLANVATTSVEGGSANTRHIGRVGVRGAVFWALIFGGGHWLINRWRRWQIDRHVDQRIRDIYASGDQQELYRYVSPKQTTTSPANGLPITADINDEQQQQRPITIPQRKQVVGMSWREMLGQPMQTIREYDLQWLFDLMPLVHNQQDFEYRQYLEAKIRLLEAECEQLERERRRRLKRQQQDEKSTSKI
jgi:hypothetical protein